MESGETTRDLDPLSSFTPLNYQVTFSTPLSIQLGTFPNFTRVLGILSIRFPYLIESHAASSVRQ